MPIWSELTHQDFMEKSQETEVAVLVTGALEAHGKHLPLGTDAFLPAYLANAVAEQTRALVLPEIPFGDSWAFKDYRGTISIDNNILVMLYAQVMKAVFDHGFRYLVAINGHGGNTSALENAAKTATEAGERTVIVVNWWRDLAKEARAQVLETPEGHAAEDETSEVMYIRPELVDMSFVESAYVEMEYRIVSASYRQELYPSAVHGDPSSATAEKGGAIMKAAVQDLVDLIENLEKGRLPIKN